MKRPEFLVLFVGLLNVAITLNTAGRADAASVYALLSATSLVLYCLWKD